MLFEPNSLIAENGSLSAKFHSITGFDTQLFLLIKINLLNLLHSGKIEKATIYLDMIDIRVNSYRELEERNFTFPISPQDGSIDGCLCFGIGEETNYFFDVTALSFGKIKKDKIDVSLEALLNIPDIDKPYQVFLNTTLDLSGISICCDKLKALPEMALVHYIHDNLDMDYFESTIIDNYIGLRSI